MCAHRWRLVSCLNLSVSHRIKERKAKGEQKGERRGGPEKEAEEHAKHLESRGCGSFCFSSLF